MTRSRYATVVTAVIFLMSWGTSAVASGSIRMQGFSVSTKLISLTLPSSLPECTPHQANSGGSRYTNLWSTRVNVIDLASEKVLSNPRSFAIRNPRLSTPTDHSFRPLIATALKLRGSFVWREVQKDLTIPTPAPAAGHGLTLLADQISVASRDALVLYAFSAYDVSQGFLSNVARGCNLVGKFLPWVTSAVPTSRATYAVVETPLASLVDGKYDPPGAMSLSELTSIVEKSQSSSTGPLPAGFKFPDIQGELYQNVTVVKQTNGKSDSVFAGWAKSTLPRANIQDPFTVRVTREGTW